jgi:hypothetical protein
MSDRPNLFDVIYDRMNGLVGDGMDPCEAACTTSKWVNEQLDGSKLSVTLTPSDCMAMWKTYCKAVSEAKREKDNG